MQSPDCKVVAESWRVIFTTDAVVHIAGAVVIGKRVGYPWSSQSFQTHQRSRDCWCTEHPERGETSAIYAVLYFRYTQKGFENSG